MKKLLSILLLSVVLFSLNAKNFFTDRFFETQISVPFSLSNNATTLKSLLQKEIEIDFTELTSTLPKNGFVLTQNTNPTFGFNLRVANIFVGVNAGLEMYERFGISRDLFKLFGEGYQAGDTCEIKIENDLDVFFDFNIDVGIDFRRYMLHVKPSFFIPFASITGDLGKVTFFNDEDGNIALNATINPKIYTVVDYNDAFANMGKMFNCMGFDVGGAVKFPITEKMLLNVNGRIPLVPGKLTYLEEYEYIMDYKLNIQSITEAETNDSNSSTSQTTKYYINRPLKLGAIVNYDVFASIINLNGGLGFGISHPFVQNSKFYLEYLLGIDVNLGIAKACLSTEYTDRVFKNQIELGVNLRLIEIDAGLSLQAANFTKSFTGSGFGGFVVVSFGY